MWPGGAGWTGSPREGVLIRSTLPAMAATLGGFALIQVVWPVWIRAHLIPAAHAVIALTAANIPSQATGPGGGRTIAANNNTQYATRYDTG